MVVPTYNEAEGIGELLRRVREAAPQADVLVVDDGSPDGTAVLVKEHPDFDAHVRLLERPGKQGLGAAYRAGFAWAMERGYDVIVQMDADLSHPPERIPALLAAVTAGADLAIGSRYVRGGATDHWGVQRRFISWAGNQYVRLVLNLHVRDATAGFRAYRRDALATIRVQDSESNGYSFQIENTWRARRARLRIVEVPITFADRALGASKMTGSIAQEAVLRVLHWRVGEIRDAIAGRFARRSG